MTRQRQSGALKVFICSALCLALQGCILVPFIDSYHKIGVTAADREALLEPKVKLFQQALYWGRAHSTR